MLSNKMDEKNWRSANANCVHCVWKTTICMQLHINEFCEFCSRCNSVSVRQLRRPIRCIDRTYHNHMAWKALLLCTRTHRTQLPHCRRTPNSSLSTVQIILISYAIASLLSRMLNGPKASFDKQARTILLSCTSASDEWLCLAVRRIFD